MFKLKQLLYAHIQGRAHRHATRWNEEQWEMAGLVKLVFYNASQRSRYILYTIAETKLRLTNKRVTQPT